MIIANLSAKLGFDVDTHNLEGFRGHLEAIQHRLSFLAGAEVLRGLFELGERFGGVAERINILALQAGVTAEEFQKLAFAAHQNGINQEEMSGALAKLTRNLYSARQGNQAVIKSFSDLGISPEQLASFKDGGQAIRAIADRIAAVEDPIRRQALTMALLGRGSSQMIKLLAEGGEAFDKYGKRAEAMGAILSNNNVEALEKAGDAMEAIGDTTKALAMQMGAALSPAIQLAAEKMGDFLANNRELIAQKTREWALKTAFLFGVVYEAIRFTTQTLADFIKQHPELTSNLMKAYSAALLFAIAMHAVESIVGVLFGPLFKVIRLVQVAPIAMGGFQKLLVSTAVVLGRWLSFLPGISYALQSIAVVMAEMSVGMFALWVAGIALALGTVSVLIHDIYTILSGGKMEDLWIYKIGEYIGGKLLAGLNTIRRFLGMKELTSEDILPSLEAHRKKEAGQYKLLVGDAPTTTSPVLEDRSGAFLDEDYKPRGPQMSRVIDNAYQNLIFTSGPTASDKLREMTTAPTVQQAFNIDARTTITVPPHSTMDEVDELMKRANQNMVDKVMRDAKMNMTSAVVQ